METKKIDTIIIGGGVAGLGCARRLVEHQKDFLMITENIGGKIKSSQDGSVNYGAYFVLSLFKNILRFVRKEERLNPFSVEFHKNNNSYSILKMLKYPLQILRLIILLFKFKKKYQKFQKQCENKSQKEVIENDEELLKLYKTSAQDFIKEKKITDIGDNFLTAGVYMCTFLPLSKVSAFDFLRLSSALILPAYEFVFLPEKATENFKNKIKIDSVVLIKKNLVTTKKGNRYYANNIVVATPPHISQKLLGLSKIKEGSNSYVFHIKGELKKQWGDDQFELFDSSSDVIFIRKQKDGTSIFYSKVDKPSLGKYYSHFEIIFKMKWEPAFHIKGDVLWDCKLENNTYLIGEHNVIGLEEAYLTGVYAANQIIKFQ